MFHDRIRARFPDAYGNAAIVAHLRLMLLESEPPEPERAREVLLEARDLA